MTTAQKSEAQAPAAAQTSQELAEMLKKEFRATAFSQSLVGADEVVRRCSPEVLAFLSSMERAMALADGIRKLKELVSDDVLKNLLPLMDSPLGFMTDRRDKTPYDIDVVRSCVIEALMYGAMPTGNEFNIIAGRCYLAKNFFTRALREYEGLTDLRKVFGVPRVMEGGAVVRCQASWILNGVEDKIDEEIPVRLNNGMGADGALGKAERKLGARIWGRITGSDFTPDGELEDLPLAGKGVADPANAAGLAALKAAATASPEAGQAKATEKLSATLPPPVAYPPAKTADEKQAAKAAKAAKEAAAKPKAEEPKPMDPDDAEAFLKSIDGMDTSIPNPAS